MLEEKHLRRARFIGKACLGFFAFFAAKGRVGQRHIEQRRRALKQPAEGLLAGEGVAMPQVRLVNAVQHKVGQGDGVNEIFLLAPIKRACLERFDLIWRSAITF